jgi:hypothetical protein
MAWPGTASWGRSEAATTNVILASRTGRKQKKPPQPDIGLGRLPRKRNPVYAATTTLTWTGELPSVSAEAWTSLRRTWFGLLRLENLRLRNTDTAGVKSVHP